MVETLPRLKRAEDVSDWLDYRRGTPEELAKLVGQLVRLPSQSLSSSPSRNKGHAKRQAIFLSRTLAPTERLLLLAIQHHSGTPVSLTAADLAAATGLHRVSVQRLTTSLVKRSLLARIGKHLEVRWDRIV